MADRKGSRGAGRGPTTGKVVKAPPKPKPKPKPKPVSDFAKGAAAPASIFYPNALTQPKTKPKPRSVVITNPAPTFKPSTQTKDRLRLAKERRGLSLGVGNFDPTRQPKQDLRAVPKPEPERQPLLPVRSRADSGNAARNIGRNAGESVLGGLIKGVPTAARIAANVPLAPVRMPFKVADYWLEGLDRTPDAVSKNVKQYAKWHINGGPLGRTSEYLKSGDWGADFAPTLFAASVLDAINAWAGPDTVDLILNRFKPAEEREGISKVMTGIEIATAFPALKALGAGIKAARLMGEGVTVGKAILVASDSFPYQTPVIDAFSTVSRRAGKDGGRAQRIFQVGDLVTSVDASPSRVGRAVEDALDATTTPRGVRRRAAGEQRLRNQTRTKLLRTGAAPLRKALVKVAHGKYGDAETYALRLSLQGINPSDHAAFHIRKALEATTPEEAANHTIHANLASAASSFVHVAEDKTVQWSPNASSHVQEAERLIREVTAPNREQMIQGLTGMTDSVLTARAQAAARVVDGAEWKAYEDIYKETLFNNPYREAFRQGLIKNGRSEAEANGMVRLVDGILRSFLQNDGGRSPQQVIDGVESFWNQMALHVHAGRKIDPAYFDMQLSLAENDVPTQVLLSEIKDGPDAETKARMMKQARAILKRHAPEAIPPHANTPAKMRDLLLDLRRRANEAEMYRRWYLTSSQAILREAGNEPKKAIRLAMLFSIYSPRAAVFDLSEWNNTTRALNAYNEWLAAGGEQAKNAISDKWELSDWQTRAANIAMDEGRWVGEGQKTTNFAQTFIKYIDPEAAIRIFGDPLDRGVMDTWMRRVFGYPRVPGKKPPKKRRFIEGQESLAMDVVDESGEEPVTRAMFDFMEDATRVVAKDEGWSTDEAQAAIWVHIKAEQEGTDLRAAALDFEHGIIDYNRQRQAKANIQELPLDYEGKFDPKRIIPAITEEEPTPENYERLLRRWASDQLGRTVKKGGVKANKRTGQKKLLEMTNVQYEEVLADALKFYSRYQDDPQAQAFFELYYNARPTNFGRTDDIPFHEVNSAEFSSFFSAATKGEHAPAYNPWWQFEGPGHQRFYDIYQRHAGEFDAHIDTSIPDYRGMMIRKGFALSEAFPGAKVLDLMGGEGSWGKTLSEHGMKTVTLDANADMQRFFRSQSTVPGARFVAQAFLEGFEDGGRTWRRYNPKERFDIVNESMGFQFISPDRDAFVGEAKRMLKPGGVFITDEKVITPRWDEFEAAKDAYKAQFYTQDAMANKAKAVLGENSAVGMRHNMATQQELEDALGKHFTHWQPYWESGNFRGYVASDDPAALRRFLDEYHGQDVPVARQPDEAPGFEMQRAAMSPEQQAEQSAQFLKFESLGEKWINQGLHQEVPFHQVPDDAPKRLPKVGDAVIIRSTGQRGYTIRVVPEEGVIVIRNEEGDVIRPHVDDVEVTTPGVADFSRGTDPTVYNGPEGSDVGGFMDNAADEIANSEALARDVAKTLPEEEWPTWVRNSIRRQKEKAKEDWGFLNDPSRGGKGRIMGESGPEMNQEEWQAHLKKGEESDDDLQGLLGQAREQGLSSGSPWQDAWKDELADALRKGDDAYAQEIMRAMDEQNIDYEEVVDFHKFSQRGDDMMRHLDDEDPYRLPGDPEETVPFNTEGMDDVIDARHQPSDEDYREGLEWIMERSGGKMGRKAEDWIRQMEERGIEHQDIVDKWMNPPGETDMLDFEFALPPDAKLLTSQEAMNLDRRFWSEYRFHGTDPATSEIIWSERRLRAMNGEDTLRGEGPQAWLAENPIIAARYADAKTHQRGKGLPGDPEERGMVIAIPKSALTKFEVGGNPYGVDNSRFGGQTFVSPEDILFQKISTMIVGAAEFVGDEGFVLHVSEGAIQKGVHTLLHEIGHLLHERLPRQQQRSIARAVGAVKNADGSYTWSREAKEKFADYFVAAIYGNSVGSKRMNVPVDLKRHMKAVQKALHDEVVRKDMPLLSITAAKAFDNMISYKPFKGGRFVGAEDIFADANLAPVYVGFSRGKPSPVELNRVKRRVGQYLNRVGLFSGGRTAIGAGPRDPSLENVFKANLLSSGLYENTMDQAVDDIVITSRMVAAQQVRKQLLAASTELPGTTRDQAIKIDPDVNATPALRRMYDIMAGMDEDVQWRPGRLDEELNVEAAMSLQEDMFPGILNGEPAMVVAARAMSEQTPIPNIRWVSPEMIERLEILNKPAAGIDSMADSWLKTGLKAGATTIDGLNDLGRAMITYFNPAYVPMNLAGNITMALIHQGWHAPHNIARAALLHRSMAPEHRALIDELMGTGFAQNIGFSLNSKVVQETTSQIGHFLGMAIDLIPRRSAWLFEANKAGYKTEAEIVALLRKARTDEATGDIVHGISMRAKEAMVDFERMSELEKRVGRWILFYPWLRGATRYTVRLAMDKPLVFAFLVGLHDQASQNADEKLGDRPAYAKETFPIGTGSVGLGIPFTGKGVSLADLLGDHTWESDGNPMTTNIRQAFPQTTPVELWQNVQDTALGLLTGKGAKGSVIENLPPGWQSLFTALSGYDTFRNEEVERNVGTFVNQLIGQAPTPTLYERLRESPEDREKANKTRINPRSTGHNLARIGLGSLAPQPFNPDAGQKRAALIEGDQETADVVDFEKKARDAGIEIPPEVIEQVRWRARLSKALEGKSDDKKARAKAAVEVFLEKNPDRTDLLEGFEAMDDEDYDYLVRAVRSALYPDLSYYNQYLKDEE